MHEGTIAAWHVTEGDNVEMGEPICDIETSKIANEFEAPFAGRVARLLKSAGAVVGVGDIIAVIAEAGATDAEVDAVIAEHVSTHADGASGLDDHRLKSVDLPSGTIRYLETGDANATTAVLFLHGFGGDHGNWGLLQAELPEAVRAIAIDLPGHGASFKEVADGSVKDIARSVLAFIDALALKSLHLVAHSFGANVAAAVAAARPKLCTSFTVIAPPALGATANRAYVEGFLAARRKKDMRPVMEMLFSNPALVSRTMVNDAIAQFRDDDAHRALSNIGAALLSAPASDFDTDLAFLRARQAAVIWGDGDIVVPMPERLRAAAPGLLHIIEGTGHMPHAERPGKVAAILAAQLNRP
jgi:pyruvate dehydrogenase E2 component (dihydrolipoamide acetyltransferase)